jgi:hypothetical protein
MMHSQQTLKEHKWTEDSNFMWHHQKSDNILSVQFFISEIKEVLVK